VRLSLRRLNLAHVRSISTSHINQSNIFEMNVNPVWAEDLALLRIARVGLNSPQGS
jgi:hypothetical protein